MNLKAYQIAEIVSGNVVGDDQVLVNSLAKIENGKAGSLSFLGNSKYNKFLKSSKCNFYDIDMLYPTDEEIENYFTENPQDVVGLSAVTSTTYLQVKRLCRIIKKVNKKTLIVIGGYMTAAANTILT